MVRDLPAGEPDATVAIEPPPGAQWLRLYERGIPVDVLTAVVDGDVVFATPPTPPWGVRPSRPRPTAPAGRVCRRCASPTSSGEKAMRATLCAALLAWATERGAQRCYAQVLADNARRDRAVRAAGLRRAAPARYVDARSL